MENEVQKKRILSGIQPSGDLTLGSYLGAIRNWAALADEYDCYYMMADMHTITVRQVPAELRRHTLVQLAAYIASGLDPEKNVLFVQSHVPAHAQLGWVLDCYTMFGDLSRIITGVLNQYYDNENVILVQSKNLRFTFEEPVAWTRDGEAGGVTTDVTLRNNHAAIHIIA